MKGNAKFYLGGGMGLGLLFAGLDLKNIAEADNKFKALFKAITSIIFVRTAFAGTFLALGAAVRSLVKETGSLEAALKRLDAIQKAQRSIAPFVGGAKQARQHVAGLVGFAADSPFRFEDVAEADRTLQAKTRGSFAGTGALTSVGDAAAASGNSLQDSAAAVGQFYEALHNGEPVRAATEQLRQMGIVSEQSAMHLDRLAESGASSIDMANSLAQALSESKGGMSSYAKELEAVSIASEKAAEGAKEAFGKGFAEPPIRSTKNYTEALVAITPALEQVGKFFSGFTQTFETWGSKITKAAAQSGLLSGAIKVLAAVVTAGAIALTAFGLSVIPIVGPFAAFAAVLGSTGLILYKFVNQTKEAARELKELTKTHKEAQAILNAHAASIQSITDLQEQYGRSVQHIIDLQNELNAAEKKGDKKRIEEIIRALREAHAAMANLPAAENLASPERGNVIAERLAERRATEAARFQESLRAEPGRAAELSADRAAQLEERAGTARQGLQTRQRVAERQGNLLGRQSDLRLEVGSLEKIRETKGKLEPDQKARLEEAKGQLAGITGQLLKIQEIEGRGATVGLEAQAQRLQHAQRANALEVQAANTEDKQRQKQLQAEAQREKIAAGGVEAGPDTGRKIQDLQETIKQQAEDETNVIGLATEARGLRGAKREQFRERAVATEEITAERGAALAHVTGQTREQQHFQDIGAFLQNFEQLRQVFPEEEARKLAIDKRQSELMDQLPQALKPIGDSLTRVGGGGGVAGPSGDPRQRVQERIRDLNASSLDVLRHIDAKIGEAGTNEAGGGEANTALGLPAGAAGTPEATTVEAQTTEQPAAPPVTAQAPVATTTAPTPSGPPAPVGPSGAEPASVTKAATPPSTPTTTPASGTAIPSSAPAPTAAAIETKSSASPAPAATPPAMPMATPAESITPAKTSDQLERSTQAQAQANTPAEFDTKMSAADMVKNAIREGRIGTKEHPLPKIPSSGTIGTKEHPLPKSAESITPTWTFTQLANQTGPGQAKIFGNPIQGGKIQPSKGIQPGKIQSGIQPGGKNYGVIQPGKIQSGIQPDGKNYGVIQPSSMILGALHELIRTNKKSNSHLSVVADGARDSQRAM